MHNLVYLKNIERLNFWVSFKWFIIQENYEAAGEAREETRISKGKRKNIVKKKNHNEYRLNCG